VTFTAQCGYIITLAKNDDESSMKNNTENCTRASALLLSVPRHQAIFLHIGKAAGGTFLHRARHVWKLHIEECHPDPCQHSYLYSNHNINSSDSNSNSESIEFVVSIRDPVDRFVSAFYWKIKTICTLHPHLCTANNATTMAWRQQRRQQQQQDLLHLHRPRPSTSSSSLFFDTTNSSTSFLKDEDEMMEARQRYILFEKYQQSANRLAESLCRHDNNEIDNNTTVSSSSSVEAQGHVGMIVHMKHSIRDWLVAANNNDDDDDDWDDDANRTKVEPRTSARSSGGMSRKRRVFRSIRPIVLEPNFDLEEQIDDALRAIAARAQTETSCPHRRPRPRRQPKKGSAAQDEEQQQQYTNSRRASTRNHPFTRRRHVHSSLQNSNDVLSEKGTRCVAQFYRKDYEIIRQLSHSSICAETCRMALESIWNRRSPLLSISSSLNSP
jgi:Sulfotransferase family